MLEVSSLNNVVSMNLVMNKRGYFVKVNPIEKNLHNIERREFFDAITQRWDIYPDYTMLYSFHNNSERPVIVQVGGEIFKLNNRNLFYAAPKRLMKWTYPQGLSSWSAYICSDENMPKSCVILPLENLGNIVSLDSYRDIFCSLEIKNQTCNAINETTEIITRYLSDNFWRQDNILNMYKDLGIPSSTAAYSFQKNFGVSPLFFRNKLRIFEALKLISQGHIISEIYQKVGFEDYTSFYRQFVSTLQRSPADFKKIAVTTFT